MKYSAKEYIMAGADNRGMSLGDVCREIEMSNQSLSQMNKNDSMRAKLFLKIMEDVLGYEIVFRDPDSGEELDVAQSDKRGPQRAVGASRVRGYGKRVRSMSMGVAYDTYRANALADTFFLDGVHEYKDGFAQELYVDREGRYFLVTYSDHLSERNKVVAVDKEIADRFIEAYGRYTDRIKKE